MSTYREGVALRNALANAYESTIGTSPVLRIRSGTMAATPEDTPGGVILVKMTLPSDWLNNASNGVKTKLGTWQATGLPAAGGGTVPTHFEIMDAAESVCHAHGTVSTGGRFAWTPSTAVVLNQRFVNNGQLYQVTTAGTTASAGGPTGTGSSITDGTAVWQWVSAVGVLTLVPASISNGQVVQIDSFTYTV
jgi:hypothetical protein